MTTAAPVIVLAAADLAGSSHDAEMIARDILFRDGDGPAEEMETVPRALWKPGLQPRLTSRSTDPVVKILFDRLEALGYDPGEAAGSLTGDLRSALLEYQFDHRGATKATGVADFKTWKALAAAQPARVPRPIHTPGGLPLLRRYKPGSAEAIALFEEAAVAADVPVAWASSDALTELLQLESGGWVGVPNYTYKDRAKDRSAWREVHAEVRAGIRTTTSTATGLGQLLLANVDAHYPSGRAGIGDAFEEAVGMLRYIAARHGTPDEALAAYGAGHEGY